MLKQITTNDLRRMNYTEGLILQGCGGDPQEWITGISKLLTEEGILLEGDTFKEVSAFEHDGLSNLLFSLERVKLDWNKLAMWRLKSHETFGGTWLSDYVPNKLGDFIIGDSQEQEKPDCPLIGTDGNIFSLMGIASQTLKRNGLGDQAKEMCEKITSSGSYGEALCIIGDYVNITSVDDETEDQGMSGMEY